MKSGGGFLTLNLDDDCVCGFLRDICVILRKGSGTGSDDVPPKGGVPALGGVLDEPFG